MAFRPQRLNVTFSPSQMNSAVPQVDHISEASLLRKSSCNYLRTGISCKNLLALIVADGVRLFKYSQTSGSITDTFCTIKIGVGNLIRDLAWAPLGWQRETLALCFDDRVELWSRLSAANTFTREATYKLGNIAGILQIIWDERIFNDILVCSSTIIHKIQLLSSSEAPTQVLPSLNTRHPGGVALSSADTLITGNKYREAVAALGFVGGTSSEQPHGRRRLLVERCRSEEGEEEGSYRHSCSLSHVDCGGLCFLSFEPEASLMSSAVTSTPFTTLPSTPSLISVVTSTPAMSAVEEDDEDSLTDMGVLSLQSHNPKPRGSFPHSAHGASISDTLSIHSIGQQSGNGHGELAHVTSALEALQSVSNCLHVGSSTDMTSKGNPGHGKSDVSLMATSGMICAVRTSNDGKELRWLGSSLSLSRSPAERSDTGSTSLLRPDVMAMCPLTSVRPLPLSGESTLSCCFLAVSSTQTGQIILYEVTEEKYTVHFRQVDTFILPKEGRCRGLCFLPVQSLPEGQSRGVVLMALAACPTDHSVASQSASATYATSIVTYNVGMDIPQCVAEKKGGQVAAGKKDDITAPSSDDRIYQLLSEMKTSFERRLDQLELTLSQQGNKIDHLQTCVRELKR